jgi:hypothetical protein
VAGAVIAGLLPLAAASTAHAKGPDVYPVSQVKKGQKGYGLTVFQGTTPERFEFEIVGVMKNYLPKMDLVLVKSDDPKITATGFAKGMSGSPLYIDGKVLCAFSYGWSFNKLAMGGCTPVEFMVQEAKTPLRGPDSTALASADEWRRYAPLDGYEKGRAALAAADAPRDAWILQSPLPPAPPAPSGDGSVQRAGIPLALSGFGPRAFADAASMFAPFGLEPMQAGGSGDASAGPTKYEMGGAIGVQLIRGDFSITGTGTVSYIDGKTVLAFGHPMFQMGEVYMPTCASEIHAVVASAQFPFKLSSPLRTIGALVQDRQSMIQIDAAKQVDMIPVDVTIEGPAGSKQFHTEVARNRFLTPQLVMMSVVNGAQSMYPDVADAIVTVESKLHVRGFEPLTFVDYMYSPDGAAGNAIASARALRVISPILFNPWSNVTLDRVDVKVSVQFKADYANIVEMRAPAAEVPYGQKFELEVTMQPFGGKPYVVKIPVTLPEKLAGQQVRIDVVPGDFARLDVAVPENVEQLVAALRKTYPGNVLVVTVSTADEGTTLGGKVVPRLPDSAIDTARPAASSGRGEAYKSILRVAVPTKRVVQGRAELMVTVAERH